MFGFNPFARPKPRAPPPSQEAAPVPETPVILSGSAVVSAVNASESPKLPVTSASATHYITRDMLLGEVVAKHPNAAFVFMQYGLHCVGCVISEYETVEQGCRAHGIPDEVIDEMVADANLFIEEERATRPSAPSETKEKGL